MSDEQDAAAATVGHNIADLQKIFFQDVTALGLETGLGTTALSRFGLRVIKAASDGLIEPGQATAIYQVYADASKSAGGTPGSIKTNASKLRKLIELGCLPDGEQLADDAMRMRDEIENAKPPFDGLVEVARQRLKATQKLSADDIKSTLTKAPPKVKSTANEWQSIAKGVTALVATAKDRELSDDDVKVVKAIRDQLNTIIAKDSEETHEAEAA
jgi:hypothetical protein